MEQKVVPVQLAPPGGQGGRRVIVPAQDSVVERSLGEMGITEANLEEFVRTNIGLLFEDDESLLIIGQQPINVSQGRADLVAVDGEGNLVLIELKRDAQDMARRAEPFESQAIRYAASCATIKTPEELVEKLFAPYVARHPNEFNLNGRTPIEVATAKLREFLQTNAAERTFNQKQRIILIGSSFDDQTLSGCSWLVRNGIALRCIAINIIEFNQQYFLNIVQEIPPPTLDDFLVRFSDPADSRSRSTTTRRPTAVRTLNAVTSIRVADLFRRGLIKPGEKVSIHTGNSDYYATVLNENRVEYNGQHLSYLAWGKQATGWSAMSIYDWVRVERNGSHKLLGELREELAELIQRELDAQSVDTSDSDQPPDVTDDGIPG